MTLIACPECGRQVSDQGPSCIHCGYPLASAAPPDRPTHRPASTESVSLRLSKATSAALWATSGLYVIAAGVFFWYLFVWNDWAAQRSPSAAATQNALDAETAAFGFLGIGFIGYAITGVLFVVWFFQTYRAAASRGATFRTWASGWTIGGWFIPLANFVIPKLVMNEVDRMSNPEEVSLQLRIGGSASPDSSRRTCGGPFSSSGLCPPRSVRIGKPTST